jgi:hypothetical protein
MDRMLPAARKPNIEYRTSNVERRESCGVRIVSGRSSGAA